MRQGTSRRGNVARAVLVIAFMLMAVPAVLMSIAFVGYRATSVQADELKRARAAEARAIQNTERARAAQIQPVPMNTTTFAGNPSGLTSEPPSRSSWQKVTETHFR